MNRLSPTLRISLGLASLSVSVLCFTQAIGLLPDQTGAILQGRKVLCEAIAIDCSLAAQRNDLAAIRAATLAIARRDPEIASVAVRRADGKILAEVGDHEAHWAGAPTRHSTPTHVHVPIALGNVLWGTVELRFQPLEPAGAWGPLGNPVVRLLGFVGVLSFLADFLYLGALMRHLNLGQARRMPERVRATLDSLVEGVLLLDPDQRIALANEAFAKTVGQSTADLEGRTARELPWVDPQSERPAAGYPWSRAMCEGAPQLGTILGLQTATIGRRTLSVNATPILGDDGAYRGALATFDDLTSIQRKNVQLRKLLERLKQSRTEIREQNQQLKDLATRDPLTGCLTRRSFFEGLETSWKAAQRSGRLLSCLMLDIDHFKCINDCHGHSVGDQALQQVAAVLQAMAPPPNLVCRYGGEEFCVVLPDTGLDGAVQAAECVRREVEARTFSGISVTASVGVSALSLQPSDLHELLHQADQALYAAKRSGRNCVARWDTVPDDLKLANVRDLRPDPRRSLEFDGSVPFPAVTSLVSALAYRDVATAEHSRRVADLCVATARGLMSESECYVLEVAALLHDIGKLGVPDAILRKPGPLTGQEWSVMGAHDRMGAEIIAAAFASAQLSETVRVHHCWYGGNPRKPELPMGPDIPLGARILAVADAYDAMVSDRVYRPARSRDEAFAELRRYAGKQFDPELVERFIAIVLARAASRTVASPTVSKRTAFKIGLQIEKLASALDAKDESKLAAMAARLKATASESRIPGMAEVAARLEHAVASASDWLEIMEFTSDLLDLCRSTQSSYLDTCHRADPAPPAADTDPLARPFDPPIGRTAGVS